MTQLNQTMTVSKEKRRPTQKRRSDLLQHTTVRYVQECRHEPPVHKVVPRTSILCRVCHLPIPVERLERYPNVTTCVPCQRLLEQPAKLRAEISRVHRELIQMEQQIAAAENLELISNDALERWRDQFHCHQERLETLQAVLYSRL